MKVASAPQYTPNDEVPRDLDAQLQDLERWAQGAQIDARRDAFFFWMLKAPAIVASASAGLCGHFGLTTASLVVAALSSFCILVDGIRPQGMLRNTHLRALHDIRNLTNAMMTQWRSRPVGQNSTVAARKIVADSEEERNRIATYVRDAESALNTGQPKQA